MIFFRKFAFKNTFKNKAICIRRKILIFFSFKKKRVAGGGPRQGTFPYSVWEWLLLTRFLYSTRSQRFPALAFSRSSRHSYFANTILPIFLKRYSTSEKDRSTASPRGIHIFVTLRTKSTQPPTKASPTSFSFLGETTPPTNISERTHTRLDTILYTFFKYIYTVTYSRGLPKKDTTKNP